MRSLKLPIIAALGLWLGAGLSLPALAGTITLPNPDNQDRSAWLDSAVSGAWGSSANPDATLVGSLFNPDPWSPAGAIVGANGTNSSLSITLTSGAWGDGSVTGSWAIDPAFWSTYSNAVISMHVGQGNGDPDYFMWLITPGETQGRFGLTRKTSGGGGLSNMKLWGSGTPPSVPDSGATGLLFGLGLAGLALLRRFLRAGK